MATIGGKQPVLTFGNGFKADINSFSMRRTPAPVSLHIGFDRVSSIDDQLYDESTFEFNVSFDPTAPPITPYEETDMCIIYPDLVTRFRRITYYKGDKRQKRSLTRSLIKRNGTRFLKHRYKDISYQHRSTSFRGTVLPPAPMMDTDPVTGERIAEFSIGVTSEVTNA